MLAEFREFDRGMIRAKYQAVAHVLEDPQPRHGVCVRSRIALRRARKGGGAKWLAS